MKKFFITSLALSIIIACNPKELGTKENASAKNQKTSLNEAAFVVDSLKIEDILQESKNLKLKYTNQILLFPTIKNKTVLDSLYKPVNIKLASYTKENLQKEVNHQKEVYFSTSKKEANEFKPTFEQNWEQYSSMKLFSNKNNILTVSYQSDGFSGGAHGYNNIIYKNVDLINNKVIQLTDLFTDVNNIDWNTLLAKHITNKEQKEMLLVDKVPVNHNFYFDDKNITFVYNQYEIAAYAAGQIYISVPFSELKPYLKPDFIKANKIK